MERNRRDELDRILDEALATYAARDTRPGLEDRVLRRLHQQPSRRTIWRWAAVAIPVAACVLVSITMLPRHPDQRPEPPAAEPRREVAAAPPAVVKERERRRTILRAKPAPIPRRAQFPTPSPLTSEERALMELAARAPHEAAALLKEPVQVPLKPIEIQPIRIEPLDLGGEGEDDIL